MTGTNSSRAYQIRETTRRVELARRFSRQNRMVEGCKGYSSTYGSAMRPLTLGLGANPCVESIGDIDVVRKKWDDVDAVCTWAVNCFSAGNDVSGIVLTASRMNHSCLPNVHHHFNTALGRLTVHALRDIKSGEEIETSYGHLLPQKTSPEGARAGLRFRVCLHSMPGHRVRPCKQPKT